MAKRTVVVQGGGNDLYEIDDYGGAYTVYQIDVGILSNGRKNIGKTKSLQDAIVLITAHSGKEIKEIR